MDPDLLPRLRELCMAFPEVTERLFHGEPAWYIEVKKQFASFDNHHHNHERLALWCAAPPGAQEVLVSAAPNRFYRPPYVGHRGWIGVFLDGATVDWAEIAMVIENAYRAVAPPRLLARLPQNR